MDNNTQNDLLLRQKHLDLCLKIDKEINLRKKQFWHYKTKEKYKSRQILNPHNNNQENM